MMGWKGFKVVDNLGLEIYIVHSLALYAENLIVYFIIRCIPLHLCTE